MALPLVLAATDRRLGRLLRISPGGITALLEARLTPLATTTGLSERCFSPVACCALCADHSRGARTRGSLLEAWAFAWSLGLGAAAALGPDASDFGLKKY